MSAELKASTVKRVLPAAEYPDDVFLLMLGQRVRQMRAQRGMSRRLLSQSADVSERYLAQLESGKGNVSILLLRQIAAAMGVRVDNLVDIAANLPAKYETVRERIRRMDDSELDRVYQYLSDDNGLKTKTRRLALLGLRGAGKTTLGQLLADKLNLPFQELTATIEEIAGMKLAEIFSLGGQASYRLFEQQAITKLLEEFDTGILAVGGSVVADTTTFEHVLRSFTTIWLQASPEAHMSRVIEQGDKRPMAGNKHAMDELRRILVEREPLYGRADFIVDTQDKTIARTCEEILGLQILTEVD